MADKNASFEVKEENKPNVAISDELKELAMYDKEHGTLYASELTLHRMDNQAIKDAGFESPGELLACYKRVKDIN